jgi:hypothetical protein
MYLKTEQNEEKIEKCEKRLAARMAEEMIENGFLSPQRQRDKDPPDPGNTQHTDTSQHFEENDIQKKKKNKKKIITNISSDKQVRRNESELIETNKEILSAINKMKRTQNRSNDVITKTCSQLETIVMNQSNQISYIMEQMKNTQEHLNENYQRINKQYESIEEIKSRLKLLEEILKNNSKVTNVKIGKISSNDQKKENVKKVIESDYDKIKEKEKEMYEKFKNSQEENPPYLKDEWQTAKKTPTKESEREKNLRNKRNSYIETKKTIITNIDEAMACRILAGKSPHLLEKAKILYFSGFKKNRIGYIRTVFCQAGLRNEDILSLSFIGQSVLEVVIKESKIMALKEICVRFKGTHLSNFNPLKQFTGKILEFESKITPKEMFQKRLGKIISQGRGPINLLKIIKNCNEENICRFLPEETIKENTTINIEIGLNGEEIIINEPKI